MNLSARRLDNFLSECYNHHAAQFDRHRQCKGEKIMLGLVIATSMIGVFTIIMTIYTAVMVHQVRILDNYRQAQIEFCNEHNKKFAVTFSIDVLLCTFNIAGFILLIVYGVEFSFEIFPLISLFVSVISAAASLSCIVAAKRNKTKKNNDFLSDSKDAEQLMMERKKILAYFNKNSCILIEKYAYTVENLIDKLTGIYGNLFLQMFDKTNIPLASILIYPYRTAASPFLRQAIRHDGLDFAHQSQNEELNKNVQTIVALYVEKLKEEIRSNHEWDDDNTLPLLIYKIIRENVIKHYHDKYLSVCGYENSEELCKNIPKPIEEKEIVFYAEGKKVSSKILIADKVATVLFIYYYIYETDVNLPYVETYKKLCLEMKNIIADQAAEKLKNELFRSRNAEVVTVGKAVRNVSPIEKIDHMTGEEFELFMTKYFATHGFKTTHTPLSGDYGIDLILENDFVKIGVQAKCYSNKVTLSAIQEVVAGLRHYGLSSGMVVTNNYFQPSAIRLAKENNITLWDRNKLIEKLGQ